MKTLDSAAPFVPEEADLTELAAASKACRGCPLWANATQTVFGEGPADARIMLIGEQPGDREDIEGHPFVGPAGHVLDKALEEAGIDRAQVYLTNAVKHFKWVPKGGRRLHAKPGRREIVACRPWLDAEIARLAPERIGLMGATAAQSLFGPAFRITQSRGKVLSLPDNKAVVVAMNHPSAILRTQTAEEREEAFRTLVADLKVLAADEAIRRVA